MYQLGISVFCGLEDYCLKDNLSYIKKAKDLGYQFIFSSANMDEASDAYTDLQTIITYANELGMKVILDISSKIIKRVDILKNLYSIRLDYGFSNQEIVDLSNNSSTLIDLNASTFSEERLDQLVKMGLNIAKIRASFNYYPKPYTGHDLNDVDRRINFFRKYQIPILIFLPSQIGKRPPLYEGLPTIESHREIPLKVAIEELKALEVSEIAFGDAFASLEELETLAKQQTKYLNLFCDFTNNCPQDLIDHLDGQLKVRPDYNGYQLRVSGTRGKKVVPFNTVERCKGCLTIDNYHFKRYSGEIGIVLANLSKDQRVNVIGQLFLSDIIIEYLKKGNEFRIIPLVRK